MTEASGHAPGGLLAPARQSGQLDMSDIGRALAAGWRDFLAAPQFGLFFAAFYAIGGALLAWGLTRLGEGWWILPLVAGFPLFAPFAAVGLYEVSRRREAGEPLSWKRILGALAGRGDEQLIMLGGFIFVAFAIWLGMAHGIFAIFLGESGIGSTSAAQLASPEGMTMLAVGTAIGGVFAFGLYAITVLSIPMLVERDVDFITAIIASLTAIRDNPAVMLMWAAIIAVGLGVAMLPAFLGLFVALPVLAHATWHLYRRATGLSPARRDNRRRS